MTDRDAILPADASRRAVVINWDRNQLEAVLLERLVWTHSSDVVENRDVFSTNIESRSVHYLDLDTPEIEGLALGGSWLCGGALAGRAKRCGVANNLQGHLLSAWAEEARSLKMLTWKINPPR